MENAKWADRKFSYCYRVVVILLLRCPVSLSQTRTVKFERKSPVTWSKFTANDGTLCVDAIVFYSARSLAHLSHLPVATICLPPLGDV